MRGTRDIDYAINREHKRDHIYRLKRRTAEVIAAIHKYSSHPEDILDLGTAEGKMLLPVQRSFPSAHCIGIDYSMALLNHGRILFPELNLVCANIQNLDFLKGKKFNVVIAAAVIEHLERPMEMLMSCQRILKPSGVLILTTPHPFWEKMATLLGLLKEDHQSVLSPKLIRELCRSANLHILEQKGFMLTPAGFKGERVIEKAVRSVGLSRSMANQLIVAGKT